MQTDKLIKKTQVLVAGGKSLLIQAAITCGTTANLAALRTIALSNVMNASSALLKARCSASAKSRPCAYCARAALTSSAWTGLQARLDDGLGLCVVQALAARSGQATGDFLQSYGGYRTQGTQADFAFEVTHFKQRPCGHMGVVAYGFGDDQLAFAGEGVGFRDDGLS